MLLLLSFNHYLPQVQSSRPSLQLTKMDHLGPSHYSKDWSVITSAGSSDRSVQQLSIVHTKQSKSSLQERHHKMVSLLTLHRWKTAFKRIRFSKKTLILLSTTINLKMSMVNKISTWPHPLSSRLHRSRKWIWMKLSIGVLTRTTLRIRGALPISSL